MMRTITILLSAVLCLPAAFGATGTFSVEEGFLSLPLIQLRGVAREESGVDLFWTPAGAFERLAKYNKLMIDQPEIWLDEDSDYRGVKPDNIKAIADLIRERLTASTISRGYAVVNEPGPDVFYLRVALTDLYLKEEKRGILGYIPIGASEYVGADMMSKVGIIEMALQAEILDSQSGKVVGAIVIKRGARKDKKTGQKEQWMDFVEFNELVQEYGARLVCRLDNARTQESQQVDCVDDEALEAAGYLDLSE